MRTPAASQASATCAPCRHFDTGRWHKQFSSYQEPSQQSRCTIYNTLEHDHMQTFYWRPGSERVHALLLIQPSSSARQPIARQNTPKLQVLHTRAPTFHNPCGWHSTYGKSAMASAPNACFWSWQCEHQNVPYILAPASLRRLARFLAASELELVTSGACGVTRYYNMLHMVSHKDITTPQQVSNRARGVLRNSFVETEDSFVHHTSTHFNTVNWADSKKCPAIQALHGGMAC